MEEGILPHPAPHPMRRLCLAVALLAAPVFPAPIQAQAPVSPPGPSGGPLSPEQAAFDVTYVELELLVDPAAQILTGAATTVATIVSPTPSILLDLDDAMTVQTTFQTEPYRDGSGEVVGMLMRPVAHERLPGQLRVRLTAPAPAGATVSLVVLYTGQPHVAANPPWDGGATWTTTPAGLPWAAMSIQGMGADVWRPVKDHPSDEPDSVRVKLIVPAGLRAISNGRWEGRTENGDGTATETWFVSNPINNYGVSYGVGPYAPVRRDYEGPTGTRMPVTLWSIPENAADMARQAPGFLDALAFMETTFGPYPWRADGYQVLQTPYLGMEHQSLIAYGSDFQDNAYGFDWLHFHEMAHEWWANLGTASDWRDFWIHESFATYAEALYAEDLARRRGADADSVYLAYLGTARGRVLNVLPVAPRESRTTAQMYTLPDGGFNGDLYFKGALVLHTLRTLVDDDAAFVGAMRRLLYPTPESETWTDGRQARFLSTDDVVAAFSQAAGRDLAGVFEVYLRQPALPRLAVERGPNAWTLRWLVPEAAGEAVFDVPVPVRVGNRTVRVDMPGGVGRVPVPPGGTAEIDPDLRLLFDRTAE